MYPYKIFYNFYIYSSPVIKVVVDNSSKRILRKIKFNEYRLDELIDVLGFDFLGSKDDHEYMDKKLH